MYLVKFTAPKWKHAAITGKSIQIGSVLYYREIENETLRDKDEGEGPTVYKSKAPLDAETHNRLFSSDGYRLTDGWSIHTNGLPLISEQGKFNPFVYSCSLVRKKSEIKAIGKKFGVSSYYAINDVWAFTNAVSEGLRNYLQEKNLHDDSFTMPDQAKSRFETLEIRPILGKVKYTDETKERVVNESNVYEFDPLSVRIEPFFQKPTRFKSEQEFRIIWVANLGNIDEDEFDLCSTNIRSIRLPLTDHGIGARPRYIKEIKNKRDIPIA